MTTWSNVIATKWWRSFSDMSLSFVSEPLRPVDASFDTAAMAQGEPGLPQKFLWGKQELEIVEVLERWKDYGDCKHGSGERYLRKHYFRVRTSQGLVARIYFQRSFGRARATSRWWLHSVEADTDKRLASPESELNH